MPRYSHWIAAVTLGLVSACTIPLTKPIAYTPATVVVDGPETTGKRGRLESGYGVGTEAVLRGGSVTVGSSSSIDQTHAIERKTKHHINLALGLMSQLDLKWRHNFSVFQANLTPALYGLKYQIFGNTGATRTRGIKWAMSAHYGQMHNQTRFSTGGNTGTIDLPITGYTLRSIQGYRWSDRLLGYVALSFASWRGSALATADAVADYAVALDSRQTGVSVGIEQNLNSAFIRLELGTVHSEIPASGTTANTPLFGLQFGRSWF